MVSASDSEPKVIKVWQLRLSQQIRKETQIISCIVLTKGFWS